MDIVKVVKKAAQVEGIISRPEQTVVGHSGVLWEVDTSTNFAVHFQRWCWTGPLTDILHVHLKRSSLDYNQPCISLEDCRNIQGLE